MKLTVFTTITHCKHSTEKQTPYKNKQSLELQRNSLNKYRTTYCNLLKWSNLPSIKTETNKNTITQKNMNDENQGTFTNIAYRTPVRS